MAGTGRQFMKNFSIGVFDSGFGGLNIMKEIVLKLPKYNYIYLADTARAPYGSRSKETVYSFTKQAVEFLFKQDCQLIILACNTASALALRKIQKEYLPRYYPGKRVLGVIIPVAEEATGDIFNNRIGVMATEATVRSESFVKELKKINPKAKVFQKACPLLVPIVEAGEDKDEILKIALKNYLFYLTKKDINALILGCTHYGLLEKNIKNFLTKDIKIFNEGKIVADKLEKYLLNHPEIEKNLKKNSKIKFFTTDLTDKFEKLGSGFFGKKITPKKVILD